MSKTTITFDTASLFKTAKNLIRFNPLHSFADGVYKAIYTGKEPFLVTGISKSTNREYNIIKAEFSVEGDNVIVAMDKPIKLVEGEAYSIRKLTTSRGYADAWLVG